MARTLLIASVTVASILLVASTAFAGPRIGTHALNPQPLPPVTEQITFDL